MGAGPGCPLPPSTVCCWASCALARARCAEWELLDSLRLATKKPWAIDPTYSTAVRRPLHLTDMAVTPDRQGQGIGRRLLEYAAGVARSSPGDAIRLDAFDSQAGAGGFYASCGYRETGRVAYRERR